MRKTIGLILCGICLVGVGQTAPATQPSSGFANITVSEMKVEDLQGFPFLHFTRTTTINAMMQTMGTDISDMVGAMKVRGITPRGPIVILMHGVTDDRNHPFELQVGFKVNAGVSAPPGYQLTDLPSTKCAVSIYSGPLMQVRAAYQKIYPGIFGAGLTPNGNIREYILYYEDVDSPNNVAMAAVEVQ